MIVVLVMLAPSAYVPAQQAGAPTSSQKPDKKPADGATIERLIRQLGSDRFDKREEASKALLALGDAGLPALRKAQDDPDPEIRRRVDQLLRVQKQRRAAMRAKAWIRFKKLSCSIGSSTRTSDGIIGGIGLTEYVRDEDLVWLQWIDELEAVQFSGARITDAGLVHLKKLSRLSILDFEGTKIGDAGLPHLKDLDRLLILGLCGTEVSDAGLVELKALKSLVRLDLGYTRITDAGLAHLKDMKRLSWLDISHTQVSDAGLAKLKGLKLYSLNLSGTQITDAGLAKLKSLKNLRYLGLSDTKVSDTGLEHLKSIRTLSMLRLNGTRVTERAKAEWLEKEKKWLAELEKRNSQEHNREAK